MAAVTDTRERNGIGPQNSNGASDRIEAAVSGWGDQNRLAAEVGVSPCLICLYLSGQRKPKLATLVRMAEILGVEVGELAEWLLARPGRRKGASPPLHTPEQAHAEVAA
jgi:transcriptional regulator with XRE-family HTH domain